MDALEYFSLDPKRRRAYRDCVEIKEIFQEAQDPIPEPIGRKTVSLCRECGRVISVDDGGLCVSCFITQNHSEQGEAYAA